MKVSCLMITTTTPSRLHLLDNTINSIEQCNIDFIDSKTLSVDVMPKYPIDISYFKKFEKLGWNLAIGACSGHRGMLNNIIRGLQNINTSDYIYYCEDDVIITRLPKKSSFEIFTNNKTKNNKNIGYACFNTHILSLDKEIIPARLNFINDLKNYQKFGDELFLIKDENILRDEYFLNFPSAIVNSNLFIELINYSKNKCKGIGIEPGLTQSWFDLKFNEQFDVATYVKPQTITKLPIDLNKFYHMANMQFWNNDVNLRHPSINERKNTIF